MKKIIFILTAMVMLGWANAGLAQDCQEILRAYYATTGKDPDTYPEGKADYFCKLSYNSFYFAQQAPQGAPVYYLNELTNNITGKKMKRGAVIDLNTLSYYEYNFIDFQARYPDQEIYFRLEGENSYPYLVMRTFQDAHTRTLSPENYKD